MTTTPRRLAVLQAIVDEAAVTGSWSTASIGRTLGISPNTVCRHLELAKADYGVQAAGTGSTLGAVVAALAAGDITL